MKKYILLLITLGLLNGDLFAGGTVNKFVLRNGIEVLHKKIDSNPIITLQGFLRSGIINEEDELSGIAGFTQMMLTKGTKSRPNEKLSNDIEDIGAVLSYDTDHDYSQIYISAIDSHVDKAAQILSDVILNPLFDEKEIENERANTIANIEKRKDKIFNVANDLLNQNFYGHHPYSRVSLGTKEGVARITRQDMIYWHKKYFTANNMFFVIMGNIELNDAKEILEKYFTAIPENLDKYAMSQAQRPKPSKELKTTNKFKQAYLMISFPAPSINDPDFATLKVINQILGGRMTSRLFVELREKLSLAYEVSSFYPTKKQLSKFVIYLGLKKNNIALTKKRIAELLTDLKDNKVDEIELSETKNYIKGVFLLEHQTINRQAWYLGWWEVMGKGYAYDQAYLSDLMKVSSDDIKKAANKYFNENSVEVEIVPE